MQFQVQPLLLLSFYRTFCLWMSWQPNACFFFFFFSLHQLNLTNGNYFSKNMTGTFYLGERILLCIKKDNKIHNNIITEVQWLHKWWRQSIIVTQFHCKYLLKNSLINYFPLSGNVASKLPFFFFKLFLILVIRFTVCNG